MQRYALLSGSKCVNVIWWDGDTTTYDPSPYTAVVYDPAVHVVATDPRVANQSDLQSKLTAALATNLTYLGLASPTTAQNTAQLQRLTRETTALIRLALNTLDDVSGT